MKTFSKLSCLSLVLGLGLAVESANATPVCHKILSLPANPMHYDFNLLSDSASAAYSVQINTSGDIEASNLLSGGISRIPVGVGGSTVNILDTYFDGAHFLILLSQRDLTNTNMVLFKSNSLDLAAGGSLTTLGGVQTNTFFSSSALVRQLIDGRIHNGFAVAQVMATTWDTTLGQPIDSATELLSSALPTAAQPNPTSTLVNTGSGLTGSVGVLADGKLIWSKTLNTGNNVIFAKDRLSSPSQQAVALTSYNENHSLESIADERYVGASFMMAGTQNTQQQSIKSLFLLPSMVKVPVSGAQSLFSKSVVSDFPSPISTERFVGMGNELRTIASQSQTVQISSPEIDKEFRVTEIEGSVVVQEVLSVSQMYVVRRDISLCF